ncbi:MAG: hypothetical protein QG550_255 [Pseudomonadota bacterium]|nr:hypothetical protein [Pseudomonadota bacterium]
MRVRGDEAGHDQDPREVGRDLLPQVGARLLPAHAGPQRAPLDQQHAAGVEPLDPSLGPPTAAQEALEEAGRPELTVAGDQVAEGRRGGADQAYGLQDARDVVAVAVQLHQEFIVEVAGQQLPRDADVALAQRLDPIVEGGVLLLGQHHEIQQRIGDATARREHHRLARGRVALDDLGDALHAGRVSDARPAEFVDFPGLHG